ncbi:extracellular solute-binding protein [uncultured Tateyamaria sp.]|uniref:extracellular solute-binding protein n=1 Tax=uncultured Tateyamaria sp. TaxID=455651 RepID=UPI00262E0BF6|nr:extracellular solute-binding protein [uncultured Tateyamaria sp.]
MYGAPQLPPDFVSLPHANPDAPKGGKITLANTGSFDSLNPYIQKGNVPWQLRFLTHESLMGRNRSEPFALYGLLAESIEVPDDRSWVEFTLRPEARFSDGSPVTVEDVMWSYETLGTEGHGRYRSLWGQIETLEQTGPRSVKFTFNTENRELALLAGMRPILQKAQWAGKDFAAATINDVPIGSGAYVVSDFEAARNVVLTRNPDYWGADLNFMKGTFNFDEITIDFYGDQDVVFEAFKAGEVSAIREFNADAWANQYDFPRATSGDVIKTEVKHQKPSGITGFVMNTRRAPFDDWRVREALITAFNFEYINDTLTGGAQPRITSYFSNSPLAMEPGPAKGAVAALLAPFNGKLLPGVMEGYTLPESDGTLRNRRGLRRALGLMEEAGWTTQDGKLRNADGTAMAFTILLDQQRTEDRAIADLYTQALDQMGITVDIDLVDGAQYTERTATYDFDMTYHRRAMSLSPGNEQYFYWGSKAADEDGTRNLMGAKDPAIDAMIDTMLNARTREDSIAATRALDRLLISGRYVVPFWQFTTGRIAHVAQMRHPEVLPIYGDGPDWMPQFWWYQE